MSDFSDAEIDEIEFLLSNEHDEVDEIEIVPVEDKFIEIIVLFSGEKKSPLEQSVCAYYQDLLKNQRNDIEKLDNKLYCVINDIFKKVCGDVTKKSTEPKTWTKYYTELYKFSSSPEYVSLVTFISHRSGF